MLNRILLAGIIMVQGGDSALALVRNVSVDDKSMAEIHLSMGKSTVLHFSEKPTKVITGNQNYFNIEFTGEDVTIQPLGTVVSNLFVYTEYYRYGFVLRVGGSSYDDLVQVRWRSRHLLPPIEVPTKPQEALPLPPKPVHSRAKPVQLSKVFTDKTIGVTVAELDIAGTTELKSKDVSISATQDGKNLPVRSVAFDRDTIDSKNSSMKARVFLSSRPGRSFELLVNISGKKTKISVQGNLVR